MAEAKLFDYNSSFSVVRTNPKLTGNLRITVGSNGSVSFNSMDANRILSNDRFKNFNITGENPFALDVYNFFDKGQLASDIIFQTARFTRGEFQAVNQFSEQYDFFYGSGASALADKNYNESFSYFAPLWINSEIPDYFVIFKVPGPLSYSYSDNQTIISDGIKYKLVQNYDSEVSFRISYGNDASGNPVYYSAGEIFNGSSLYSNYTIIEGSGIVVVFDELANIDLVDDVETLFKNKILPNATAIKTFDLTENSKIGKYIRSIFNDKKFKKSPVDVSWGPSSYTYFNGVSIKDGIYSRKGEILSDYFASDSSDSMIDFESYITSGFSRNGIISPNLLNLEFLFDDDDSDIYTINRYMGFYVSRNDLASLRLNGDFFYKYRNIEGNDDLPKPSRNSFGYYYDSTTYPITAESGIMLFYENGSGFLPGSNDTNILDSNKLYYITDKDSNFYSLSRSEFYGGSTGPNYGPYDYSTGLFSATGSTGATSGNVVIQNKKTDLHNFTGTSNKVASIPAKNADSPGRAYCEVEFLKKSDLVNPIYFKLYWPNGSLYDGSEKYDLVESADLSAIIPWVDGSFYSTGNTHYFNAYGDDLSKIASSFSNIIKNIDQVTVESGVNLNSSVIRLRDSGTFGNDLYSISIFGNYSDFESRYKGIWDNTSSYSVNDIVKYDGYYYTTASIINAPSSGNFNLNPISAGWNKYDTFTYPGYVKINGIDAYEISGTINFTGGTRYSGNRLIFGSSYEGFVNVNDFVVTKTGKSRVMEVSKYTDEPVRDTQTNIVTGFDNFTYSRVAILEDEFAEVDLGSSNSFNSYKSVDLNIGVFSFFDMKEFDFDFFTSNYSYTPTAETYKYYQIQPGVTGSINNGIPYLVKRGQIIYNNVQYDQGSIFYGTGGITLFASANPDQKDLIVFPAQYSTVTYNSSTTNYGSDIGYNVDLDAFNGFIGIQSLTPSSLNSSASKLEVFNRGKLSSEYDYLEENYTTSRANISRIVPYINKWAYTSGTDSRGNLYRLNSTPAFSPTNFSPSLDRNESDSRYLTHEWLILEKPPRDFPISEMKNQNSYLPGMVDLDMARSSDPADALYLSSVFTVEPSDYSPEYRDLSSYTKELFTPFSFNESSGYYETLFRGIKVVLKKRSNLSNSNADSLDKYIRLYRGYEDYKFSAIIRVVDENSTSIQSPVSYEIIENEQQKFVLFVCYVLINDYKSQELGYSGLTGGDPILDYTLLYSLSNKEKLNYPLVNNEPFYKIGDIKLSAALDLSLSSGSVVNTTAVPGIINSILNPDYDTDLREEINTIFSPNTAGATAGPSPIGAGSFYVNSINSTYPWPIGVGPSYIEFGKIATGGAEYTFDIQFSASDPVTVPVGPSSVYKNQPVFQVEGGEEYYNFILKRTSAADILSRINGSSPYIKYKTYYWDPVLLTTKESLNSFELYMEKPSRLYKGNGSRTTKFYGGPQTIGESVPTSYIIQPNQDLPSSLLRYSGGYSPLFRKVVYFDYDKTDTISGDNSIDLSFRNCNFAPNKEYFGILRNLPFTKVDKGNNILSLSKDLPEGPVYPLVGQSPIWKKNFNIFSSSWDPGYYDQFNGPTTYNQVAGTRSMKENKSFLASKIMKTPGNFDFSNYITLEISRTSGSTNINDINNAILGYSKPVQNISPSDSGIGIGNVGPYLSGVDYNKLDISIFPNAEIIWQYFPLVNKISGIIRLDRMLRRYLLNSGIKQTFIDNIISDFGVGNPDSIDDDVNDYIDLNVSPLFQGNVFDLFVNKTSQSSGSQIVDYEVRGDINQSERFKMGYYPDSNYKLTRNTDLIYNFEYNLEKSYNYSILFNLGIIKI
jgi:hypothetical protein